MAAWVRAEIEFASFYSYRVPDLSPSYAVCSPLPSPAAIRLALVDATIRHTGSVQAGRELFELVKTARLEVEPSEHLAVMKFFIKRLKPEKPTKGKRASVLESTGIREYCLPDDPIVVWLETDEADRISQAFMWLRRLGTTDSLAHCKVDQGSPDLSLCWKPANGLPLQTINFAQRAVFTLHEIKPDAKFEQIDPFANVRRGEPFEKRLFILPLVRERVGENWVIYRREPFHLRGAE
jgi:hypothetical protein